MRSLLTAALLKKQAEPRTAADLVVIACALASDDYDDQLLEAAGVVLPPEEDQGDWDHESAFVAALQAMDAAALTAFVMRLALGELRTYAGCDIPMAALEAAAASHKVDISGARKKAEKAADADDNEDDE
jgi:hypothetical protein